MYSVEIVELGARLRSRRVATGRTIASVAADAGLSVPYIANLENGRGNPTLSAVNRLAEALGGRLSVDLVDDGRQPVPGPPPMPETLVQFTRTARFAAECTRLAETVRAPKAVVRQRLLHAMAVLGALTERPLNELDWHRILDTVVLITYR
jgi:transcriptional regulator with XRE-family HTH domain